MEKRYTLTDVNKKYDINVNTLRYYERIGLLPPLPRAENGNRYFDEDLLKWLEMVLCLRQSGVAIEVLQNYVKMLGQGEKTLEDRKKLLVEQEKLLVAKRDGIESSIEKLRHKIKLYETGEININKEFYEEYGLKLEDVERWKSQNEN